MECENVSLQLIAELFFVTSPPVFLCMQHNSAVAYEIFTFALFHDYNRTKENTTKSTTWHHRGQTAKKTKASCIQDKFLAKKEKQLMMNDNAFSLVVPSLCSLPSFLFAERWDVEE